jgi:ABC-type sugar transport system substrate-binding protein
MFADKPDRTGPMPHSARLPRKLVLKSAVTAAAAAAAILGAASASTATTRPLAPGRLLEAAVTHPTFVYLQTNGSESYFVDEGKGAVAEATKLGATVRVENESNSSATTISDEQSAVASGVNGIIVVAPAATLGPRLVSIANKAGIPISASDNGFAGANGKAVPFVGINAAAFGANTGQLLVKYFKQAGWSAASTYAVLYVVPSLPTCNLRTNAEKSALTSAGFPASHIINVPYDGTTELALTNTAPVLTAHPQAQHWLAAGCNDDGVFGGAKAMADHRVTVSNIIGVGLGGDLACQIWAKGAPSVGFRASNYIYPNGIGAKAVLNMYNYVVKHIAFPANTYVAPEPITQGDFRSIDQNC